MQLIETNLLFKLNKEPSREQAAAMNCVAGTTKWT